MKATSSNYGKRQLSCYHKFIYFNRTKLDIIITNNQEILRLWGFDIVRWRYGHSSKWTKNYENFHFVKKYWKYSESQKNAKPGI